MNANEKEKRMKEKDIYSIYVDVFKRYRADALAARACRTWMLTNVATRCQVSETTVRNAVPMSEHKKIIRRYC